MDKRVLVAYTTNAGSTEEVAKVVGDTLGQNGALADVQHVRDAPDTSGYDAVLVGGPVIMGWHRDAVRFVTRHQQTLSRMPVAYFLTAMNLTQTPETSLGTVPIYRDPALAKAPREPDRLSFKERHATVASYLGPVLKKAPLVKPVSIGIFGGRLNYGELNILQMLFVMLVVGAQPGDRRDWEAIRAWAADLRPLLES